jgi:hypothetical protein
VISNSLGDTTLNYKVNGTFLYDEDITNSAVQFYTLNKYNNNFALKVSNMAWVANQLTEYQYTKAHNNQFYAGRFNYVGQTLRNGNQGVVGAGIGMRTPLEVTYKATPRATANPDQVSKEYELNFYVSHLQKL